MSVFLVTCWLGCLKELCYVRSWCAIKVEWRNTFSGRNIMSYLYLFNQVLAVSAIPKLIPWSHGFLVNSIHQSKLFYSYQLDQWIYNFRVVGWDFFLFIFIQIFIEHYVCKKWTPWSNDTFVVSDLCQHCLFLSLKWTLGQPSQDSN